MKFCGNELLPLLRAAAVVFWIENVFSFINGVCVFMCVDRIESLTDFLKGFPRIEKWWGISVFFNFFVKQIFYGVVVHQCVLQFHLVKQILRILYAISRMDSLH